LRGSGVASVSLDVLCKLVGKVSIFGGFGRQAIGHVFGGEIVVRPIAGTRERGATPEDDRALEAELLADEKERAEHLMLIDLGRNDVGRVSKTGSVKLRESFVIERYSHVMHIVSEVQGELRDGLSCMDVLKAAFPAGTVSGAPKIRLRAAGS